MSGCCALNLPMRPTSQVAANEALELMTRKRRPLASRIARAARPRMAKPSARSRTPASPDFGQAQAAPEALDQRRADLLFELAHLLGDRRLGDEQFFGRARERQMPRHRLEGAQGVKGG